VTELSDYKSIVESHPDLISRYDADFKLTFVNRSYAEYIGKPAKDFIGLPLEKLLTPKENTEFFPRAKALTAKNPKFTTESETKIGAGQPKHFTWTTVALFDESDVLTGYQTVGREISPTMKLNAKLDDQNKKLDRVRTELRVIMDALPVKIFYKDSKNNILRVNKAAAESLDMKIEDIEGKSTYDLFADVAKAYHEDDLKIINSGEAMLGYEERYVPAEGHPSWVRTDKIPFDDPITGEKHIVAVVTDITEQKEREALLENVNRNLDDFAALTSHDLQAPLRHIALFSELLEAELGADISPDAANYVSAIRNSAENMRNIILTFLKFMRSSPDKSEFEVIRFSDKMKEIADEYKRETEDLGGGITVTQEHIWTRGDENLLGQVIRNLISNAIKYRHPDRPPVIDIKAKQKHGIWAVTVSDNGRGVAETERNAIFNLFNRSKIHNHVEGSGIGLALSKRFIMLHGGEISAHGNKRGGTDFVFTLNRVGQTC
jgi:PAS domain S-box-containing protein